MLGIGLGIDYGLLVISRFREERGAGLDVPAALHRTMATAGRTVVFSAATVAVALVGLARVPRPDDPLTRLRRRRGRADDDGGRGDAAAGPAGLGRPPAVAGRPGVVARSVRPARPPSSCAGPCRSSWWSAWVSCCWRRRSCTPASTTSASARCPSRRRPARWPRRSTPGSPRSRPSRSRWWRTSTPDDPRLAAWVDGVSRLPGVAGATVDDDVSGAGVTVVEVHAEGETNGRTAQAVVREVRALDPGFPVLVGGDPAEIVDLERLDHVPPADRHRHRGRRHVRAAVPDDRLGGRARSRPS